MNNTDTTQDTAIEITPQKLEEFKALWAAMMSDQEIKAAFTAKIHREIGNILTQEGIIQR